MNSVIPKLDRKFFISWLSCTLVMFGAFYLWHGTVLNDFHRLDHNLQTFLVMAGIVYLCIGLVLTILTYALKKIKDSFRYGLAIGAVMGMVIFATAFVFGIRFYATVNLSNVLLDFGWQVVEQAVGGLICGWVYRTLYIVERHRNLA